MERIRFCKACGRDFSWRRRICTHCRQHQDHPIMPEGVLVYISEVSGESFENYDGTSRQRILARCEPGDAVELALEPENRYDRNAVQVCVVGRGQVGYLPRESNREFVERQRSGWRYASVLVEVRGGYEGAPSLGAWIRILEVPPHVSDDAVQEYAEWWRSR